MKIIDDWLRIISFDNCNVVTAIENKRTKYNKAINNADILFYFIIIYKRWKVNSTTSD